MIGEKKLKQISDMVLRFSKADETEVLVVASDTALTRFANNRIHQNMATEDISVSVRAVAGKKVGVASRNINLKSQKSNLKNTNKKSKIDQDLNGQLRSLADKAMEIARASEEDPEFAGIPAAEVQIKNTNKKSIIKSVYDSTVKFTAAERAKAVGLIINKAEEAGLNAFGSLSNGLTEYLIANSKGIYGYHPVSTASLNIRVMTDTLREDGLERSLQGSRSGYAGYISTNIADIDFEKLTSQAVEKATGGGDFVDIKPGEYEVILEEPAVAEMMQFLSYLGFGAKQFHEGSSFLSGRLGEKVLGENVTIIDSPFHPLTIPMMFDFEGMPKESLTLIDKGVAKNIVYDYAFAKKHGKKPTGHGLPAPNTEGPLAFHLTMKPGATPRSELIKKVKRGILVTRFWYVNPIHPKLLNITGMTRDGTFLIENGKIMGAVRNLRFTQSIPEALSHVLNIAREVKTEESWVGASVVPALHLGKWNFTGESKL